MVSKTAAVMVMMILLGLMVMMMNSIYHKLNSICHQTTYSLINPSFL